MLASLWQVLLCVLCTTVHVLGKALHELESVIIIIILIIITPWSSMMPCLVMIHCIPLHLTCYSHCLYLWISPWRPLVKIVSKCFAGSTVSVYVMLLTSSYT